MVVLWLYFVSFCLVSHPVIGHIPDGGVYYDSGEPDSPIFVSAGPTVKLSRATSQERLDATRRVLADTGVDAYIVPTADAHNSQYIAASDARREWLSGLTGSSGSAVVTAARALLWTDGRYFTQFYMQVDTALWALMRQGTDLTINQWLASNLTANSVVGVDPTTYTRAAWDALQAALAPANITLRATPTNLVDLARLEVNDPAPARPNNALIPLTVQFTGKPASEKISELSAQMLARGASALVLTALDDIAYTLNLRGSDIPYNPVFFSYLVIRVDALATTATLFWSDGVLSQDIVQHLATEGVTIYARPYGEVFDYLSNELASEIPPGSFVWLPQVGSHAIHLAAEADGSTNTLSTLSPVALMKCYKNPVELQGFRSAHVKDGVAVVRFLRWVHEAVTAGHNVTEMDVSDKLEELRADEADFMGPSFATIAGAGENGAVIHYKPSREQPRVLRAGDVLLVDSGAQYRDGTTDITRTRHMSDNPTDRQRLAFTRVLKGQILMGTAVFPRGATGNVLDSLARKALWDVGLDYAHGTAHGVGHFLNVHEGPSGIASVLGATDPGITPTMIFSNEPGYYEVGEFGIRHEDLVEVIEMNSEAEHILADGMVGDFEGRGAVAFRTISLVPHQTSFLDVQLLNDVEIKYLNDYHARVLSTLGPILQERGLHADYEFLRRECAPVLRSVGAGAALLATTPMLLLLTILTVCS